MVPKVFEPLKFDCISYLISKVLSGKLACMVTGLLWVSGGYFPFFSVFCIEMPVDPDQPPHSAASEPDLQCLHNISKPVSGLKRVQGASVICCHFRSFGMLF